MSTVSFWARTVNGSLQQIVTGMAGDASLDPDELFLPDRQPTPYTSTMENNEIVTMYGIRARKVGIGCGATVRSETFMVSDSFASCVPVVAMNPGGFTTLVHCASPNDPKDYIANWDRDDGTIIVIRKSPTGNGSAQTFKADVTVNNFEEWDFKRLRVCNVPQLGDLAVIVRGRTILTYHQASLAKRI